MDESSASSSSYVTQAGYSTVCKCGRSFTQLNAYANHQRTCKKRKKYLSNALAKAKEVWTARKRLCKKDERDEPAQSLPPTWHDLDTTTPSQALSIGSEQVFVDGMELNSGSRLDLAVAGAAGVKVDRDPLFPNMAESAALSSTPDPPPTSDTRSLLSRTLQFFLTLPNTFGLSHQYYGNKLLTHDPEEVITLENLTLTVGPSQSGS
ncbi:hypothetical protein EV702DRAFT_1046706 [Suillus placidus]|uniref:C2H2-type domain-containing protein n=1 Tax=Suillus placidus TaxID=48579 RepID=A0A9P6ZS82_9AGAM|nr:hypothetical protein EV702DRAFT_1046706 [Suillus placidus]